jgi:hypothetical protein
MNSFLFKEWFFEEFVPSARKFLKKIGLPQKAILVVDNAKCHLSEDELQSGDIKIHFLPPNVTAILQPMDQGGGKLKEKLQKVFAPISFERTERRWHSAGIY